MPGVSASTTVYKHMEYRWAERLVRHGEFFIGTLESFRKVDALHPTISDPLEGSVVRVLRPSSPTHEYTGKQLEFAKRALIGPKCGPGVRIAGIEINLEEQWPNAFAFCLTRSRHNAGQFDPKYDTVVEVTNVPKLTFELCCALRNHIPVIALRGNKMQATIKDVVYRPREIDCCAAQPTEPYLIKPPEYQDQQEVRVIWHIPLGHMDPLVVVSKDAAKLCRIIDRRPVR